MVYSSVSVIYGIKVNKTILKNILSNHNIDTKYDDDIYDLINRIDNSLLLKKENGVQLFFQTCCREDDPCLIIGYKLAEYKRKEVYCGNIIADFDYECCRDFNCDICLGTTINGVYDVRKIHEEYVECNTFCMQCKKDRCNNNNCSTEHKQILKEYQSKIISSMNGYSVSKIKEVERVLNTSVIYTTLSDIIIEYYNDYSQLSCKFYYFIDDCISCS